MQKYEFKVVPAPRKGRSAKGVRGKPARYANAMATLMNEFGRDGWDYVRADTLEFEERSGLFGRTTEVQTMLVFRRTMNAPAEPDAGDDYFAVVERAHKSVPRAVREIEQPVGRRGSETELRAAYPDELDDLPPAPSLRAHRGTS